MDVRPSSAKVGRPGPGITSGYVFSGAGSGTTPLEERRATRRVERYIFRVNMMRFIAVEECKSLCREKLLESELVFP
jgi:hypothetical protein